MFQQLLESRARPVRRRGGGAVSVAAHAAAIGLAVAATARGTPAAPESPPELVYRVRPPAPAPEAPRRPQARPRSAGRTAVTPVGGAAPAPRRSPGPALPAVAIGAVPPVGLPGDPGPLVDAREFTAGLAAGPGGAAAPGGGAPFEAPMVDEPVAPDPRNPPPRYPEALRAAGVGGRAVARFVVDTLGRVEPGTVRVASADDPRFAEAAREALGRMRFRPARAGGVRVRQLVELPFAFAPGGPPR